MHVTKFHDEPSEKGSCEKPTHAVIPRNALFMKQETRIPQDSTPQAPTVGNKPEKQQRMGAKEGKGCDLQCSTRSEFDSDINRNFSTCSQIKQLPLNPP